VIYLTRSFDLDVPAFSDIAGDSGMINNSSKHFRLESPLESMGSTTRDPELNINGDAAALLWGSWVLDEGSHGVIRGVQLLRDVGEKTAAATVELASSSFALDGCGVRSVGGVCVRASEKTTLTVADCSFGGLGGSALCMGGIAIWDDATATVATSTFSNGKLGSYGIRVADAANVTLKDLLFERLYTAVCVHGESRTDIRGCTFREIAQVAVHVDIDDDSNPFATLRDSFVKGRVWGPDGAVPRPLDPEGSHEHNVTVDASASLKEIEEEELQKQTAELEGLMEELKDLDHPDKWAAEIARDQHGIPTEEGFSKLSHDLTRVRGVLAKVTNTSVDEMRETLGPEWAPFLQAPIEDQVEWVKHGRIGPSGDSEESSTESEHEGGRKVRKEEGGIATAGQMAESLTLMQGLLEKLPPSFKHPSDDRILSELPKTIEDLRSLHDGR